MLHQVKPVARKTETATRTLFGRRVPADPNGVVTLHLGNGAPGVSAPVQVTHGQMRKLAYQEDWTHQDRRVVQAYKSLYPSAR